MAHAFKIVNSKGDELAYVKSSSYTQGEREIKHYYEQYKSKGVRIIHEKK